MVMKKGNSVWNGKEKSASPQNLPGNIKRFEISCLMAALRQWMNSSWWQGSINLHRLWKFHTGLEFNMLKFWLPIEMLHLLLSAKRTLNHWATIQSFLSLAHMRRFWCLWARSGLTYEKLKLRPRSQIQLSVVAVNAQTLATVHIL